LRKALLLAVVGAAFAVAASPATAVAPFQFELGTPDLSARVLITVPVTVTCQPFDSSLTMFLASVSVSVEQAAGTGIARGTGTTSGGSSTPLPFTCNGTPQTVSVPVQADPAGRPFHGGQAVFRASASAGAGIPCPGVPGFCFSNQLFQSGSIAPQVLNMH